MYEDHSFCFVLRPLVLCHSPNVSAGDMESEKSFKVLLQAELHHHSPHMKVLVDLYEQVAEFVCEEEGLGWSVLHKNMCFSQEETRISEKADCPLII